MAGIFTAALPAFVAQHLQHITVADLGARERHRQFLERLFKRKIAHQRTDGAAVQRAARLSVFDHGVKQLIAIEQRTVGVAHEQAIGIAIERQAKMRTMLAHRRLHGRGMRRTAVIIDVHAIGLIGNGDHLGAQLAEYMRRDIVGGAVCAIDHQTIAAQIQRRRERAFAEFNVAAGRIADAPDLAQRARCHRFDRLVDHRLDGLLDRIVKLLPIAGKKFDAIVIERIMRCRNHDARRQPQRARQIGHTRRRHRPDQQHIHAGGRQPRLERALQHVPGDAGVLADDHRGARAIGRLMAGQHSTCRMAKTQHKFRRDRQFANLAAHTIGTKIFSTHAFSRLLFSCFDIRIIARLARVGRSASNRGSD